MIRIVRVIKLVNSWTSLRNLIKTIAVTLKDIRNLVILLFIFVFVSALVGMELFAYKVRFLSGSYTCDNLNPNALSVRRNFDNFFMSMLSIFVFLTGDDWFSTLTLFIKCTDIFTSLTFFLLVIVIGNFILMKMFLAILIINFSNSSKAVALETKR